jgi:glycosyltransferase involved in cell wall biosynthesis
LNDPRGDHQVTFDGHCFNVRGFERHKIQFVLAALKLTQSNDLVYMGHPNLAPIGLLLKLFRPAVRYVVTAHGTDVWQPLNTLRRWGLRGAAAVTAPSNFTASTMVKTQRLDASRVSVLPWAIEPKLLNRNGTAHRRPQALPEGNILLTVGRMDASERLKGIEEVLRALPLVLKDFPETYYVIIGEGDDRPRLQRLAHDLNLGAHAVFMGHIGDQDLAGYYEACDVFVMPSRQEGFGLVFLEAMAFGKPVIGGNHGGTPDVVLDEINGFLVEHGDVETLGLRLVRLLGDAELRHKMGEKGRQCVFENHTFNTFRDAFIRLLNDKKLLNGVS